MKVHLTPTQLDRFREVLGRAAGLVFQDSRCDSLGYGVAERLRSVGSGPLGSGAVDSYLELVQAAGSSELQRLVDEVTIQETHFFRNPPQIRALRQHVLPDLLREADLRDRRLRIWSAGCSTGDEPYTIAMMLRELLPSTAGWDVKVIATDISQAALAAARTATYGARAVQLASPDQLARFFTTTADGRHQVRPEVTELVEFGHHNLVADPVPAEGLDLVLCRNVTIYFGRNTTRALVGRLHGALRDGGYLFLGHSETLWQVNRDFHLVALGTGEEATFVYRRLDAPSPERRSASPVRRTEQERPTLGADVRSELRRGRTPVPPAAVPLDAVPLDAVPMHAMPLDAVRLALDEGRYTDAARLARLAVDSAPLTAEVHHLLGRALLALSEDEQALVALRRAVYLAPDSGLSHFLLAGALARCGDPAAAAREYRAAAQTLGHDPKQATAAELGGRSVGELAALCAQLDGQLSRGSA